MQSDASYCARVSFVLYVGRGLDASTPQSTENAVHAIVTRDAPKICTARPVAIHSLLYVGCHAVLIPAKISTVACSRDFQRDVSNSLPRDNQSHDCSLFYCEMDSFMSGDCVAQDRMPAEPFNNTSH